MQINLKLLMIFLGSMLICGCTTARKYSGCESNNDCRSGYSCRIMIENKPNECKEFGWTQPSTKNNSNNESPKLLPSEPTVNTIPPESEPTVNTIPPEKELVPNPNTGKLE